MAKRFVALLRGVNVGGKNRLPMADLAEIFREVGCADVRTYIQSGNVVFSAAPTAAKRVATAVTERVAKDFGFRVPVVLRTADELTAVARENPYLDKGCELEHLYVAFLAGAPDPRGVALLDPKRSPPDTFVVRGREIYMCFPEGAARTKLTNDYFDSRLATTSTARNWRTVLKLAELAASPA